MTARHALKRSLLFQALFAIVSVMALNTAAAAGAADVEGSQDHPLVGRYEGAEITG